MLPSKDEQTPSGRYTNFFQRVNRILWKCEQMSLEESTDWLRKVEEIAFEEQRDRFRNVSRCLSKKEQIFFDNISRSHGDSLLVSNL